METYGSEKIWLWRQCTIERRPSVQTLKVGVKKLRRAEKGNPDVYLAFRCGVKSTILGTTNGFARVKNSRLIFLVLGGGKNFAEEISKALLFPWSRSRNNLASPLPPLVNSLTVEFIPANLFRKRLFADSLLAGNWSLFFSFHWTKVLKLSGFCRAAALWNNK